MKRSRTVGTILLLAWMCLTIVSNLADKPVLDWVADIFLFFPGIIIWSQNVFIAKRNVENEQKANKEQS